MSTKLNGDIAEQAVILACLKRGYNVLVPVGDRLPYDLVLDIDGKFIKIQVKKAFATAKSKDAYLINTRRMKTNRKRTIIDRYVKGDFDFAIAYISETNAFYIFPFSFFNGFKSMISLVESETKQRIPRSRNFREAWNLLDNAKTYDILSNSTQSRETVISRVS